MMHKMSRRGARRGMGLALYERQRNLERAETVAGQIKSATDEQTLASRVGAWETLTRARWKGRGGRVDDAQQA